MSCSDSLRCLSEEGQSQGGAHMWLGWGPTEAELELTVAMETHSRTAGLTNSLFLSDVLILSNLTNLLSD